MTGTTFQQRITSILSSGRPFQPLLPSYQPSIDFHQLFLARFTQTPHRFQFEKTVRQLIKVMATIPDRTVFRPGKFRVELTLEYLPFSALLIFNLLVREGVLQRADPDFCYVHPRGKTNVLYLLHRALVDVLVATMSPLESQAPLLPDVGAGAGAFLMPPVSTMAVHPSNSATGWYPPAPSAYPAYPPPSTIPAYPPPSIIPAYPTPSTIPAYPTSLTIPAYPPTSNVPQAYSYPIPPTMPFATNGAPPSGNYMIMPPPLLPSNAMYAHPVASSLPTADSYHQRHHQQHYSNNNSNTFLDPKEYQRLQKRAEFIRKLLRYAKQNQESSLGASMASTVAGVGADVDSLFASNLSYQDRLLQFMLDHYPEEPQPVYQVSEESSLFPTEDASSQYRARVTLVDDQDLESSSTFPSEEEAKEDVARLSCEYLLAYWTAARDSMQLKGQQLSRFLQDEDDAAVTPTEEKEQQFSTNATATMDSSPGEDGEVVTDDITTTTMTNAPDRIATPSAAAMDTDKSITTSLVFEYFQKSRVAAPEFQFSSPTPNYHSASLTTVDGSMITFQGVKSWSSRAMAKTECANLVVDRLVASITKTCPQFNWDQWESMDLRTMSTLLSFDPSKDLSEA